MAHPSDWGLEDPTMVGSSEYAAIYETLVDALEGCEEDVAEQPRDFALAILDEFISRAQMAKESIKETAVSWYFTATSEVYGSEDHGPYDTEEEAEAGIERVSTAAAALNDSIERDYTAPWCK